VLHAAGCAGHHQRLDRGGEPERRCGKVGANHITLVSGRKGPTLTLHDEYVYAGALGCAATPRPARSKTKRTRGKIAGTRVGEGGGTCKKFPSTARRPASHDGERSGVRAFGLTMAHKAGACPWLDDQASQREGECGAHQWSNGTRW
jgi:hypothetical protein